MQKHIFGFFLLAAVAISGCGKNINPATPASSASLPYSYPFVLSFGSIGNGNGQFNSSEGIAVADGSIFVCDNQDGRIERFTLQGYYQSQFGTSISGFRPQGAAFGAEGILFVTDGGNNKLQAFDLNGNPAPSYLGGAAASAAFSSPYGVAIDNDLNLYVAEVNNNRIQKCGTTLSGSSDVIKGGTASGTGPSQFNSPQGIALDKAGNVWVADTDNNRIQEFDANLNFLFQFPTGAYYYPTGIVVDSDGNLLVVQSNAREVQKFDPKGNLLGTIGTRGPGTNPGQYYYPDMITVDNNQNVYVSDLSLDQILIFAPR